MSHTTAALPAPSSFATRWTLDPTVVFLNHGSFGGCPREVLAEQTRIRAQMESEPVRFFVEELQDLMDRARDAVAGFVDCDWDCLAFLPNATTGVAVALESVGLQPGDEILVNDHEYAACLNNARRIAQQTGAKVVSVRLPWPVPSEQSVVDAVLAGVTSRTRVALISHVTSPSGLVLPVEKLIPALRSKGIVTLIDGAHAPGMIDGLSMRRLDPDYYTANCHKWICSPKGSAFLYVRRDRRESCRPLVLSNNAELPKPGRDQYLTEFDYIGTSDYSAMLSIPVALETMSSMLSGGFSAVMRHNRTQVLNARRMITGALGIAPVAPESMIGSIASIFIPARGPSYPASTRPASRRYGDTIQERLIDRWRIQVPIMSVPGTPQRVLRISSHLHNSPAQYEYLLTALRQELAAENENLAGRLSGRSEQSLR
ncbi:MAG: aminotransferase class V-fold PLP-dependent enzyme [Phycisphaerales bacterium]|nr:aminotransferase class V-fold PLP-dependent enzyme [Planctomycetota bacterium]